MWYLGERCSRPTRTRSVGLGIRQKQTKKHLCSGYPTWGAVEWRYIHSLTFIHTLEEVTASPPLRSLKWTPHPIKQHSNHPLYAQRQQCKCPKHQRSGLKIVSISQPRRVCTIHSPRARPSLTSLKIMPKSVRYAMSVASMRWTSWPGLHWATTVAWSILLSLIDSETHRCTERLRAVCFRVETNTVLYSSATTTH